MVTRLKITPPKDGLETNYACGLRLWGSWASRLEQHKKFIKSDIGKHILQLEEKAEQLDRILKAINNSL